MKNLEYLFERKNTESSLSPFNEKKNCQKDIPYPVQLEETQVLNKILIDKSHQQILQYPIAN